MPTRRITDCFRQVVRALGNLPARYERISLNRLLTVLLVWAALLIFIRIR